VFRTIGIGLIALAAVAGVLGAVFAVGWMRIRLAESGSAQPTPAVSNAPVATPPTDPASSTPLQALKPDPVPAISIEAIELPAEEATLSGGLRLDKEAPPPPRHTRGHHPPVDPPPVLHQAIVGFKDDAQVAEWTAKLPKSGAYEVDVVCACTGAKGHAASYIITIGDQELREDANPRGGQENYQVVTAGNATFSAGEVKVRFRLSEPARNVLLRLRSVRLIPAT
jgi:hypothetical protein